MSMHRIQEGILPTLTLTNWQWAEYFTVSI